MKEHAATEVCDDLFDYVIDLVFVVHVSRHMHTLWNLPSQLIIMPVSDLLQVVVFEDLEEALDWHYQQFDSQVSAGPAKDRRPGGEREKLGHQRTLKGLTISHLVQVL